MASAYGAIESKTNELTFLPLKETLDDGTTVYLSAFQEDHFDQLHQLLNVIIEQGTTYPQEFQLNKDQFRAYFQTAFVLVQDKEILGAFYVKPNFPGRCNHICNGGFIVEPKHRNRGVGKALGRAFLKVAPAIGYQASMFNLVFENNVASVKLWKGLGFQVIGRVPKAGRLKNSNELVDALMFYYDFNK